MDQEKIGKFIAECRKECGYTQASLAKQLGITDRAVSKWENGRCMPDVSLMQALCALLHISVNELLMGERIAEADYKQIAEQNLTELRRKEEQANKSLLSAGQFIVILTAVSSLLLIAAGILLAAEYALFGVILCTAASAAAPVGIIYAVTLEHEAGYYECPKCRKRYVPSKQAVVWSVHFGTTRLLKCPYCQQRGYHKKVLTQETGHAQ